MHRIDSPGNVLGQFSAGNPQTGQRATVVSAEWMNDVQENLADLIEFTGTALVKGDATQVRDAVIALIAGVVGTGGGSVPTTRQVLGGGLVTGGGALAADITLTVAKALQADVAAGTLDTKAVTPQSLAQALGANLGSNYIALPGGGLIQWGTLLGTFVEGSVGVTLPTSFLDGNYGIAITPINQAGSNLRNIFTQRVSKSTGGFVGYFNYDGEGSNLINGLEYIATGRYA